MTPERLYEGNSDHKRRHDDFYNCAPFKKDRLDCLFDEGEKRNYKQIIEEEGIAFRLDFSEEAQHNLRLFPAEHLQNNQF